MSTWKTTIFHKANSFCKIKTKNYFHNCLAFLYLNVDKVFFNQSNSSSCKNFDQLWQIKKSCSLLKCKSVRGLFNQVRHQEQDQHDEQLGSELRLRRQRWPTTATGVLQPFRSGQWRAKFLRKLWNWKRPFFLCSQHPELHDPGPDRGWRALRFGHGRDVRGRRVCQRASVVGRAWNQSGAYFPENLGSPQSFQSYKTGRGWRFWLGRTFGNLFFVVRGCP